MPKTADGVEFVLGMTLYMYCEIDQEIREYHTSPETYEIYYWEHFNLSMVRLKGRSGGIGLYCLYSTSEAAVSWKIEELEAQIEFLRQLASKTQDNLSD